MWCPVVVCAHLLCCCVVLTFLPIALHHVLRHGSEQLCAYVQECGADCGVRERQLPATHTHTHTHTHAHMQALTTNTFEAKLIRSVCACFCVCVCVTHPLSLSNRSSSSMSPSACCSCMLYSSGDDHTPLANRLSMSDTRAAWDRHSAALQCTHTLPHTLQVSCLIQCHVPKRIALQDQQRNVNTGCHSHTHTHTLTVLASAWRGCPNDPPPPSPSQTPHCTACTPRPTAPPD